MFWKSQKSNRRRDQALWRPLSPRRDNPVERYLRDHSVGHGLLKDWLRVPVGPNARLAL